MRPASSPPLIRDRKIESVNSRSGEGFSANCYEAAEKAGLGIKKEHPILQVAVYDGVEGVNKIIELP